MKIFLSVICLLFLHQWLNAQAGSVSLLAANGATLSTHASISEAYAAISQPVNQAYTIELQNNYVGSSETVPLVLGAKSGTNATNTITIRPAANFSSLTLSAPVSMGNLLELNDADYLILDGRAGGVGNTPVIGLNNTALDGTTIALRNGSSHNIIRYLNLQNGGSTVSSSTISLLGFGTTNPGNSFNRFEHNVSIGSRNGFYSYGNTTNPNQGNLFYGNEIQSVTYSGIYIQTGTSGVVIDSNQIYATLTPSTTFNFGILFDNQTDTAIIRNNLIYDIHTTNNAASRGISIRGSAANGLDNYTEIYNNFISLDQPSWNSTSVVGIEYAGIYLANAKIMFNTVIIGGTLNSGGISEQVLSAAFSKTASNAGNNFYLRNNIFINNRSGGVSGGQHVAVHFGSIAGIINSDYNTYNSVNILARYGTGTYSTVAGLAFVMGGSNEANSNTAAVQLSGFNNLRLSGSSLGNPLLAGTSIAGISRDKFNQSRSNAPYRGAHEASPSLGGIQCTVAPAAGNLTQSDTAICPGQPPIVIRLQQAAAGGGIVYEWQESTDNTSFTTLEINTTDSLVVNPVATRWYKVIVRCVPSANQATTNTIKINRNQLPVVGSLLFSRVGAAYQFTLSNSAHVGSFTWNFGDGSPEVITSLPTAGHTYTVNGPYPVRVKANNRCGIDSIQLNLNVSTVSVNELAFPTLRLFPNPTNDKVFVQGIPGNYELVLRDMQGRLLDSYTVEGDFDFSMTKLQPAIYWLEIRDKAGNRRMMRIVKN